MIYKEYIIRLGLVVVLCSAVQAVGSSKEINKKVVAREVKGFGKASVHWFNTLSNKKKRMVWKAYMKRKKSLGLACLLPLFGGGHCLYVKGSYISGVLILLSEFFCSLLYVCGFAEAGKKTILCGVGNMAIADVKKLLAWYNSCLCNHTVIDYGLGTVKNRLASFIIYHARDGFSMICIVLFVCWMVAWLTLPSVVKRKNKEIFEDCLAREEGIDVKAIGFSKEINKKVVAREVKGFGKASVHWFNTLSNKKKRMVWKTYMKRKKSLGLACLLPLFGGGHCLYVKGSYISGVLILLSELLAIFLACHGCTKWGEAFHVARINALDLGALKKEFPDIDIGQLNSDKSKNRTKQVLVDAILYEAINMAILLACITLMLWVVAWFTLPSAVKRQNEKIFEDCLAQKKVADVKAVS